MSDAEKSKNTNAVSWLFFVAMLAQRAGVMITGTFLVYYITERMLITTIVMTGLMFAARLGDLFLSLAAGVIVQKFRPKLGQYRFWLLWAPFVTALGCTMCFINPAIPMMAKAAIVFVGYVLYGGGMSFFSLSQNGMLARIAGPDMKTRMQISGKIIQGQNAGPIIASATMIPFIQFLEAKGVDGYSLAQLIFVSIGAIGQLCLFLGTKQYEKMQALPSGAGGMTPPAAAPAKSPGIGSMIIDTMKNGQLIILFVADSLRWGATMSMAALGAYFYNLIAKNSSMMTVALTTQSFLGLVLAFGTAPLARKLGKKTSALVTGVATTAAYVLLAFFARGNAVLYMIFTIAAYASQLLVNSCGVNLYLDCGEYQYYKFGKDNRTFVMSIYSISIKIGFMISSVVVGLILTGGGYNGAQVTNPERMVLLIGLFPAGLNLLYTLFMSVYGITEAKSREYAEANHKRSAA